MTIWIFALKCTINTSWSHLIKEKVTIVLKRNERVNFSADFGANTHDNFVVFSFFTSSCRRTSLFQKDFQIGLGLKKWCVKWVVAKNFRSHPTNSSIDFVRNSLWLLFKLTGCAKKFGKAYLCRLLSFKHVNVILTSTKMLTPWRAGLC